MLVCPAIFGHMMGFYIVCVLALSFFLAVLFDEAVVLCLILADFIA